MQNTKRNTLRSLGSLVLAVGLGACTTQQLYSDSANGYTENIKTVLASKDGRVFAAIGNRHHYVFENKTPLIELLQSDLHPLTVAHFQSFYLKSNNAISGEFKLNIKLSSLSAEQLQRVQKAGFALSSTGAFMSLTLRLQGQRYDAGGFKLPASDQITLNKDYTIEVRHPAGPIEKVLMTPLAVVSDGILLTFLTAGAIAYLHPFTWAVHCLDSRDHLYPCPSKK